MLRFLAKGWVDILYVQPSFHFTYFGFDWVQVLPAWAMYGLFGLLALSAACIMLGWRYRLFSWVFFLGFTYVELIDKTTYLNHYYFVSLVSFILCFLPAHRYFSLDVRRDSSLLQTEMPRWMLLILQGQLAMVYFFAGIAKLHYDWLVRGMPMAIWLPPLADMPIIGPIFRYSYTALAFSWIGCLYDLTIPFWLWWKKTRPLAYVAVVVFHVMTWLLFNIGMFPWIMILATLVFFSPAWHEKRLAQLGRLFSYTLPQSGTARPKATSRWLAYMFAGFFCLQLVLPFRYLAYPGELFWHEQGFRFSWRVMLMEKVGSAFFTITEPHTGREWEPTNASYLTPLQEKMMATQPDMILQYAHYLGEEFKKQGVKDPEVRAKVYVSLNGRRSKLFIDPEVDLYQEKESFRAKSWVLPFANPSSDIAHD